MLCDLDEISFSLNSVCVLGFMNSSGSELEESYYCYCLGALESSFRADASQDLQAVQPPRNVIKLIKQTPSGKGGQSKICGHVLSSGRMCGEPACNSLCNLASVSGRHPFSVHPRLWWMHRYYLDDLLKCRSIINGGDFENSDCSRCSSV
jgi:hypothetical protein